MLLKVKSRERESASEPIISSALQEYSTKHTTEGMLKEINLLNVLNHVIAPYFNRGKIDKLS